LEIRPVQRVEIEQALRLILAAENRHETDLAVVEFLQLAVWRGLDLTGIWVAVDPNERIQWAVLPIPQPGRTISLLVPPRLRPGLIDTHVAELCASACIEPRHNGVNLAQVMMDTQAKAVVRSLVHAGFEDVAELMYLAREVRSRIPGRIFRDTTLRIWKYDRAVHARFLAVIERSYEDSLDCPKLNGKRHIEDVVSGHKATGEFDPNLWHLVSDVHNNDLGVILLNRMHRRAGLELVYMGIVPEARGKGLGDGLIRLGINALAEEGGGHIVTAVDAANGPARRLYHRHGFGYLHSKRALVKTLTPATPQTKALITTTAMILRRQGVPAPLPR
jgi:GNAT superfamily N-acetyltransferase